MPDDGYRVVYTLERGVIAFGMKNTSFRFPASYVLAYNFLPSEMLVKVTTPTTTTDKVLAVLHDVGILGFSINSAINFLLYICISPRSDGVKLSRLHISPVRVRPSQTRTD